MNKPAMHSLNGLNEPLSKTPHTHETDGLVDPGISKFLLPTKQFRELFILACLNENPSMSQHILAERVHLSSTMVNNYIRRLADEGLIRVEGHTNRSMRYSLTPKGYNRLSKLFIDYSVDIVRLYIATKHELVHKLMSLPREGVRRVVLFGAGETCEIVFAALKEMPVQVVGIVDNDPEKQGKRFFGIPVEGREAVPAIQPDCVLITSYARQDEIFEEIRHLESEGIRVCRLIDL
ncbi:MAG: winged helix-turn-helix transcriptional regulator [Deltaproteobacteria bacterium]|nr:winged helix-turn-helix transcriptional regulator [Deltaproteobacteria bacterium]